MKLLRMLDRRSTWFAVVLVALCVGSVLPAFADGLPAQPSPLDAKVKSPAARSLVDQARRAYSSGNLRLTMVLLKQATQVAPKEAVIHLVLGRVLMRMNFPAAAEPELRMARQYGEPDEKVLPDLLSAMLAQHHDQNLVKEFSDPGPDARGPVPADILKARAQALEALGRKDEAVASIDRSLSLRRDVSGILVRAQIATKQGNTAQAKGLVDEALKLDPHNGSAMQAKVRMLLDAHDFVGALALNDKMVREFPKELAVRVERVEILEQLKQDDKARAEMGKVVAMTWGSSLARYYQAVILSAKDKKAAWRIAQSLPPEFVHGRTVARHLAEMAIGAGFVESGASILSAALVKSPDAVDLRLRLAALRLNQKSPQLALSVLAPVKNSDDPAVMDLLSQAYLNAGKDAEGFAVLDRMQKNPAVVVDHLKLGHAARPQDGEITFHLVRALDVAGNRSAAKDLLKSLLDSDVNFEDLDDARKLAAAWRLSG